MYYKLKCDPLTPWDSYNCGEWDYLAYTRIFDHTGVLDSVQVDSVQYLNNYQSTSPYNYEAVGVTRVDTIIRVEHQRTGAATTLYPVSMATTGSNDYPFDLNNNGNKFQMIVSASELLASGIIAGDIHI